MGAIASIRDLRAALRRQAWLILLLAACGVAAALSYAAGRPVTWAATAVVQIEPSDVAAGATGLPGGQTAGGQLDLIELRLRARDSLAAMAERFGLFPGLAPSDRVARLRDAITITKLIDPAQAWRTDVQPAGLTIAVRLDAPVAAAEVANALAQAVVDEARGRASAVVEQTLEFQRAEEARVRAALSDVEDRIAGVRAANIASLPEALDAQRARLTALSEDRIGAERDLLEFEAGAGRLRADDADRQRALLQEARDSIAAALTETQAALDAAPEVERQLTALGRELANLESELAVVIADRRDAETAERLEAAEMASRFAILETAEPPTGPVSSDPRKVAVAGAVAATLLAVGVGLGREMMQPAIRTAAQMQRTLGIEPVVVIPRLRPRRRWPWGALAALFVGVALLAWGLARSAIGSLGALWPRRAAPLP